MAVYKGHSAVITVGGTTLGYADEVTIDVDIGLETFYEIGSKFWVAVSEGNFEVTGSISKAWVDISLLGTLGLGSGDPTTPGSFDVTAVFGGNTITIVNCRFETVSLSIPQDGFLMEDYDFVGQKVTAAS